MRITVAEIASGIYRLSTFVPAVGPTGFAFKQFLIDEEATGTPFCSDLFT